MNAILQTDVELVSNEMQVQFREFNPLICGWLEFSTVPSDLEKRYVEVFNSWFYLGKLGFNAENLQIQEEGLDINYMTMTSLEWQQLNGMHNMVILSMSVRGRVAGLT